jgi:hypothetical protein
VITSVVGVMLQVGAPAGLFGSFRPTTANGAANHVPSWKVKVTVGFAAIPEPFAVNTI